MAELRFLTAGESHGPALSIILEGCIANLPLLASDINQQLARRQKGYGRGARMKIETDQVKFLAGVRHGYTLGSPIAMLIENSDHKNWLEVMSPAPVDQTDPEIQTKLADKYLTRVRPGHADYSGAIKYDQSDVRNVLERSSARETTSRVAAGAICRVLLAELGIRVYSHVTRIGPVQSLESYDPALEEQVENSPVRCISQAKEAEMIEAIDAARKAGESLGGQIELIATGLPVGIGSHVHWDRRLDGLIAQAIMSIHTVKEVSFGIGAMAGVLPGSEVHDEISLAQLESHGEQSSHSRYKHRTNRAGGIEGGMSNGEPIVCQMTVKPIPTLARSPENSLRSIDLALQDDARAFYERSDVCVVPAAGVIGEAMLSFVLARELLAKFGGDSLQELKSNFYNYCSYCQNR